MSESKRAGGLYYQPDGTAVDADGQPIEGAPKRQPDTDPSTQPGALNAPTSEERMGRAIADALSGKTAARDVAAAAVQTKTEQQIEDDSEPGLPTLANLPAHLETLTTVAAVEALQATDIRKGAQSLYDARIAEIEAK